MEALRQSRAWLALVRHRRMMDGLSLRTLFERDPHRFSRLSAGIHGLLVDYSKQRVTGETMGLLLELAAERRLEEQREALFAGEPVNASEGRAALHMALRDPDGPWRVAGEAVDADVRDALERVTDLADALRSGAYTGATGAPIRDVVNIGIGGSDLGPRMVVDALGGGDGPRLHFVSNVDGVELQRALAVADPRSTLLVVVSKSFGTPETSANAHRAMAWLRDGVDHPDVLARQCLAITANRSRAGELGLDPEAALPMWDWVGGRYSLWSAVGLTIAVAAGGSAFRALLAGAAEMDRHFREAPMAENLPVLLGLLTLWNATVCGLRSHAVVPYTERLRLLPAYLQQLIMESNGKSVTCEGKSLEHGTAPAIWGQTGTPAQHAFFQALHQGTDVVPVDFIGVADPGAAEWADRDQLLANLFAQSQALMAGRSAGEAREAMRAAGIDDAEAERLVPFRTFPGGRPSTMLLLRDLSPRSLGMLLALYEHRTFVEGALWGINSFDQWGVELGKQLAASLLPAVSGETGTDGLDASTAGLVRRVREWDAEGEG